jgi:hypothetical protein
MDFNENALTITITGPLMDFDESDEEEYQQETIIINLTINNKNDIILNRC